MTISKRISVLFLALTTLSCSLQPPAAELDYDKLISLDAEDLAEGGIGEAYERLQPELRRHVANPWKIEEQMDENLPRYAVRANGQEFVVYSPDISEEDSWGIASYTLFKIVNDQLASSDIRFYAVNGGNDLGGMFLTPEQVQAARAALPKQSDWPYIPEPTGPWYGMPN